MDNLFKITKNILYRIAKKRSSILVHVILPAIVILGLSVMFTAGDSYLYKAAVVDLSHSKSSEYILGEIEATEKFEVINIDESDTDRYITEGISGFVLIIPEDFETKILAGNNPEVTMKSLKESEGAAWMRVSLNLQINNLTDAALGAGYDGEVYHGMIENLANSQAEMQTQMVDDYSSDIYATQPIIGMYLMFVLMSASTTAFLMMEEKRIGTFARIGTSPVRPRTYTMANVLSNMLILTLQLVLVLVLIKHVAKINFYVSNLEIFIILFTYILCAVGIGLLIASATEKSSRAHAIFYLMLSPSCMIAGCFWPIEFMPVVLQKAALITPQRWALTAVAAAQNGESILLFVLVLVAYAALLFIGSAYFIKYREKQV